MNALDGCDFGDVGAPTVDSPVAAGFSGFTSASWSDILLTTGAGTRGLWPFKGRAILVDAWKSWCSSW